MILVENESSRSDVLEGLKRPKPLKLAGRANRSCSMLLGSGLPLRAGRRSMSLGQCLLINGRW